MLCSDSCSAFPEKIVCFGDKGRHEFAPFVCGESGINVPYEVKRQNHKEKCHF